MISVLVEAVKSTRSVTERGSSMKTLKFSTELVPLILSGEKTSTWRLFDDKDLRTGDIISLLNSVTKKEFAKAQILAIKEKTLGQIGDEDFVGHERFESKEKMFDVYKSYYGNSVNRDTIVKIVDFKLN